MENNRDAKVKSKDRQILKSTFIMGASSIINSLLGIVRTKIIALMLGPSGVGLAGIYLTITNMISTFSGMGIGESGVRQIAGADRTGDERIISRTVITVRRAALLSGSAGLCLLFFFSGIVSRATFGNGDRAYDIALLSASIFFTAVSLGQTSLIQGMRRIGDLAKVSVMGGLFGTLVSVPIVYFLGQRGIASYLVAVSAILTAMSWWYSRKIKVPAITMTWRESMLLAKPLLKLGFALMLGAFMTVGTQYLLRVFVIRYDGLSAAGIYQASTTLSLVYVGIILNAMLTDFYPRLSAAAADHDECRMLINKQVEIGLLLAVPGILGIMTFAPFVIFLFYSSKFMLAVDILRWQILGVLLQVVAWPMGFMLRAKGNGTLFFWTELFANSLHLGLAWLGLRYFGLVGTGMAFFAMNLSYLVLIFCLIRRNYSFNYSPTSIQLLGLSALATWFVFLTPRLLPGIASLILNTAITACVGLYSLVKLSDRTDAKVVPAFLLKLRTRFGFQLRE